MRKIKAAVVTGPTGAIGVALCKLLIRNGIHVFAVCRPDSKRISNLPAETDIIECDLSCLESLDKKIKLPVDAFFHFGWQGTIGSARNDMFLQTLNIRYALDAVHAAEKLGCNLFIGAGSQAELGRVDGIITSDTPCFPENGYGMAKLCAGHMCRVECGKLGMDFIWTRILSVYGPCDGDNSMISSVIRTLLKGEKPSLTYGNQMWDYIYSEDAAKALYLLAEKGISGKTYILAGGKSRKLREYVEILRDSINNSLQLGFGEIDIKNPLSLKADISDLVSDTGFIPETDFKTGIIETIDYIKQIL